MEWLNYHHLLYFWVVAKQGSIVEASKELRLAHPTISGQIHRLETILGTKLFIRKGRNLVLTDTGRVAFRYAEEIFALGGEFLNVIKGNTSGRPIRVVVGISDTLAKSMVYRILQPIFALHENIRVVCREDSSTETFMGELATNTIDVILSDAPAGPGSSIRAYSHPLGDCGTAFVAAPPLARSLRKRFPQSLHEAPFLLPGAGSTLRRLLEEWFESHDIQPKVVAELDDAALGKTLSEEGLGIVAVPDGVEREVQQRNGLEVVGRSADLRQRFFAISIERKIRHPAIVAICEAARNQLFQ